MFPGNSVKSLWFLRGRPWAPQNCQGIAGLRQLKIPKHLRFDLGRRFYLRPGVNLSDPGFKRASVDEAVAADELRIVAGIERPREKSLYIASDLDGMKEFKLFERKERKEDARATAANPYLRRAFAD